MYLADVDPRNEQFEEERSAAGFDNNTGTFTVKDIPKKFVQNPLFKQGKLNQGLILGRGQDLNAQTFILNQNKMSPVLPSYQEEQLITDWKDVPEEEKKGKNTNNTNNTIYGLPKMVVYGGGAVLTLAILYFILKD